MPPSATPNERLAVAEVHIHHLYQRADATDEEMAELTDTVSSLKSSRDTVLSVFGIVFNQTVAKWVIAALVAAAALGSRDWGNILRVTLGAG